MKPQLTISHAVNGYIVEESDDLTCGRYGRRWVCESLVDLGPLVTRIMSELENPVPTLSPCAIRT